MSGESIRADRSSLLGSTCREQQLWCAVLNQILDDCAEDLPDLRKRRVFQDMGQLREIWDNIMDARLIVAAKQHKWRSMMCDFAGINEEKFVERARLMVSLSS